MRYLGLDVGQKKIGVAVGETLASDLTTLASPKNEIFYSPAGQSAAAVALKHLLEMEEADAIVIGLPVDENGQATEESRKISEFGAGLEKNLGISVHYTDETLTSFMAEEMLASQGLEPSVVAEKVHQAAAALILQQYLEENENI